MDIDKLLVSDSGLRDFLVWLMSDSTYGCMAGLDNEEAKTRIQAVCDLIKNGGTRAELFEAKLATEGDLMSFRAAFDSDEFEDFARTIGTDKWRNIYARLVAFFAAQVIQSKFDQEKYGHVHADRPYVALCLTIKNALLCAAFRGIDDFLNIYISRKIEELLVDK